MKIFRARQTGFAHVYACALLHQSDVVLYRYQPDIYLSCQSPQPWLLDSCKYCHCLRSDMFLTQSLFFNIIILNAGLALVGWLSHYAAHRFISLSALERHYSVSAVMFQVLGSIAGIMQAFVVVGFWNSYQDTVNSAHQEVENLTVTYRNLVLLPESPTRTEVIDRYKQYVVSILADELPGHGRGKGPNTTTQTTMDQFWESLRDLATIIASPGEQALFQVILTDANAAAKLRQHRVNGINSADSNLLWVVLIASSLLVMVAMGTVNIGRREKLYYLLTLSLAFMFSMMIAVANDYSTPYEGTITISDNAYGVLVKYFGNAR